MTAASIKSLRAFTKELFSDRDSEHFIDEVKNGSDRALIVMLASLVDSATEALLRANLRRMDAAMEEALFGTNGPLRSFSSKINMAFAMRLISAKDKDQLHVIRELRNAAAHSKRPLSFKTKELKAVLNRLADLNPKDDEANNLRDAFTGLLARIASDMFGDAHKTRGRRNIAEALIGPEPSPEK